MVMKMKYKIVCIKEQYIDLAQKYPSFLMAIYQNQDNMYKTKQVELIFSNMSDEKEKIIHAIQSREDYSYYHGIHQLTNSITGEKMLMTMNEFDLNIEEKGERHDLFNIISSFSKNFYMIY